jgi:outer membrane protein OmpA-like peptidoglycan-associated protein
MSKRRDLFSFFANPFVVLADIMVCLVCIIALFLLSTTVYSEELERLTQMQSKRDRFAQSLTGQLRARSFQAQRVDVASEKYRIGDILEVESDGTLQRFRFLSDRMNFKPNSDVFQSPENASRLLAVLGATLLQNRSSIKSIVIEGHAASTEKDAWLLSQRRAEAVRSAWDKTGVLGTIVWSKPLPVVDFLRRIKVWDETRFHEWHREEYQARRQPTNGGLGVIPESWLISSGRGDQVRGEPVVEFKIEYTERDAPSLDEVMSDLLSPDQSNEARRLKLVQDVAKNG